ncbi:MAG: putative glycoside hydrolase [Anaerohalosphaeraceae bacterium]
MIKTWFLAVLVVSNFGFAQEQNEPNNNKTVLQRVKNRDFPSVFQAWSPCDSVKNEDADTLIARHDLIFCMPDHLGLKWNNSHLGLADNLDADSIQKALQRRQSLLQKNPNLIILAEIRYYDAPNTYLPQDHAWYQRDPNGIPLAGWSEGGYWLLDYKNPEFREHLAKQAKAVVDSGVYDGIMLDWWRDDADRLELVKTIRKAIGTNALILCNANDSITPQSAPYINGYFMECTRSKTAADWTRIADSLQWAGENLRKPTINCLETWFHNSREDLNLMRSTTTLSMTVSDGYCLFSDPNPLPSSDHLHSWYPFWDTKIGKPTAKGKLEENGCYTRTFEKGLAVYNPMGNPSAVFKFPNPVKSAATGKTALEHAVPSGDGDLFLN